VTPEIDAMLDGHMHFGAFPQVAADRLIAVFSANWRVTVSTKKTTKKNKNKPDIERLENFDEVWALCARKPTPGWRILGRFYEKHVFIALRAWDKHVLVNRYDEATDEVIKDWNKLFGGQQAHSGKELADYLGEAYIDVDQQN
jgi:predicted glycoside hydrolase/deacetylase ChbG (UPF0249 family)